jgi:large subunit ribosomal protein L21
MYAVIETGGKQYRVEVGTELEVELLDAEPGKTVTVDRVLLVVDGEDASIGRPVVDGASVSAEVIRQGRGEKVIAFKYRPKARRRVKKGHRQELTMLRVNDITLNGKSAAKASAKAATDAKGERSRLEEAAAAQAAKDAELAARLASAAKAPAKTAAKPKAEAKPKTEPAAKPTAAAKPAAKAETAKADASAAKADTKADAAPVRKPTTRARSTASTVAKADEKPVSGKSASKPRTTKKDS